MQLESNFLAFILVLSPLGFMVTAIFSWFYPGIRPKQVLNISSLSGIWAIGISMISLIILVQNGPMESPLLGYKDLGFSVRLDFLSGLIFMMISFLGMIILRFSQNYLDGDLRQGVFLGRLSATLATVQLLVISGNLALLAITWILTSVFLHRLLVFYSDRPLAKIAARKKFWVARIADFFLLTSFLILYTKTGTGNLGEIFDWVVKSGLSESDAVHLGLVFLALAAIFKSAQFPTHGWLIEVMETPTPVSALLHAGLLNSGPFLIIRFSNLFEASTLAPLILMGVGGITAILATLAYLTQTSVKTALGYSSMGHMGFSLMLGGLGLYAASLLHLISHSFYKAHAFLSSGSAVESIQKGNLRKLSFQVKPLDLGLGLLLSLGIFGLMAWIWNLDFYQDWGLLFVGSILILGLFQLFSTALANKNRLSLLAIASMYSLVLVGLFFLLENSIHGLIANQIPEVVEFKTGRIILAIFLGLISLAVVLFQVLNLHQPSSSGFRLAWAIHFRNGLYANAVFDRMVGGLRVPKTAYLLKQIQKTENSESLPIQETEESLA